MPRRRISGIVGLVKPFGCPILFGYAVSAALVTTGMTAEYRIDSPDGNVSATIALDENGRPTYRVDYRGQPVILPSRMGFAAVEPADLTRGYRVDSERRDDVRRTWANPFGERSQVMDAHRAMVLSLLRPDADDLSLTLECRAYDAGFAFRYAFSSRARTRLDVIREDTEFVFTGDHTAWPVYRAQGGYSPARLSEVRSGAERPLTLEVDGGPVIAVGEAALIDFARMKFDPRPGRSHALQARLDGPVKLPLPGRTPWRYVMVADTPGRLLERNDLLLNLNEPSKLADTSWIRPGKVIRETTLTTAGGIACVDFCRTMNLQYIEFDAGWYGYEYDDASDARTVTLDPKRSKGPLDLPEVIRHAADRGVGVILYVNRRELERRLDELLPLYAAWGVAGVKYGFVNVGSHEWTAWLHDAIRKAGDARLMLDIHDEYRLTGNQRAWPHVMTVEGIRGNEEMPEASHNCALPFTRYLGGPGDYTPCWYSNRIRTTRAHQLALAAVCFSPWQFLFWYDRPAQYRGEPELDFWRRIPTVWDDTRVIHGRIGAVATLARRSGDEWYVGTINAIERRRLSIPLSFLTPGRRYLAQIYADGNPDGDDPTLVSCSSATVSSTDTLTADLATNGGHAVRLAPAD